ncbi:RlfA, partial [Campylobacter jejuni]|nr:RlfA [Campylobacter jejuni]EJJ7133375.1 RlfA [Campylobacter jejuni]HDV7454184.1 RlfA [Campylobacter jejuni]
HESNIVQLVDLLIGAISYKARNDIEHVSEIKNYIINKIETLANIELDAGTPPWENKFNIFRIQLSKGEQ